MKVYQVENQQILSKLQEYDLANKKFEDAFGQRGEELSKLSQVIGHLNSELIEKNAYIESITEENQHYLAVITKTSLGGGKASNGTMVINAKALRAQLMGIKRKGLHLDGTSSIDYKSQFCPSNYGRSPLLPQRKLETNLHKKSVGKSLSPSLNAVSEKISKKVKSKSKSKRKNRRHSDISRPLGLGEHFDATSRPNILQSQLSKRSADEIEINDSIQRSGIKKLIKVES